ncbi:MAG TPA: acyl carrier protein [Ktedonobacterales bacterium]|nr:acyl carrier protein [Ktedonobacterales bacterium]
METSATGLRGLNLIRQQVREFIAQSFFYDGSGAPLADDMPLVETGAIDQTGILEIALFIEETFGVLVDEADLTPENFDTVESIARFIYLRLANG